MTDLKQKLLDDLAPRPEFAKAYDLCERTIVRLGLPTIYIGRKPFIVISKARAKLMGEDEKPKRGRPPGTARKAV